MPKLSDTAQSSGGLQSPLGRALVQTRRGNPTEAEKQRERDLYEEPCDLIEGGRRKIPIRYD